MSLDQDKCDVFCFDADKVTKFKGNLPDVSKLAELFKVLSDETRTKILYILAQEEMCVCDLAVILDTSVSNISHHLRLLRTARLVRNRRQGRMVYYALDDQHVFNIINGAFAHMKHL